MKRYERMSKEEIIEYIRSSYTSSENPGGITSGKLFAHYLEQEIQIVPRYMLIKTDEDVDRTANAFARFCDDRDCDNCKFCKTYGGIVACFTAYLKDLVEVEEERE